MGKACCWAAEAVPKGPETPDWEGACQLHNSGVLCEYFEVDHGLFTT